MKNKTWYLAGPMTGVPQDNFPLFAKATEELRANGCDIITPIELDGEAAVAAVLANPGLTFNDAAGTTWGYVLGRDVEIIAEQCTGVVFLDGWENSRGARLEAFVAILCGHEFGRYLAGGGIEGMSPKLVLTRIARHTNRDLKNG